MSRYFPWKGDDVAISFCQTLAILLKTPEELLKWIQTIYLGKSGMARKQLLLQ